MGELLHRISEIARLEGVTIGAMEKQIGASKGVLSRAIQNDTDIQAKWLSKIVENYPGYSADWLLSGNGEAKVGKVTPFVDERTAPANEKMIPVYDMAAAAGFTTLYQDSPLVTENFLSIPNLPPVDGAIYARGDSMSPLISSGDIVVFKKVEISSSNIQWGHIYIISYTIEGDDYTVLKYIRRSPKTGYIRLESFNGRYNSQDIPTGSITALALVKASISFHTIG